MPDAPLTLWIRRSDGGYYRTMLDPPEPDAVEYLRKDAADAMLTHAVNEPPRPQLRTALLAIQDALEDNDLTGAMAAVRACLKTL